jgi:hypothetical protein
MISIYAIGYIFPQTGCRNHQQRREQSGYPHVKESVITSEARDLLFASSTLPYSSPRLSLRLTQRASFPILLLQMISRVHRHHHHHGTAPRLMMCA